MQEISHLAKETGSQSCCSVLNAFCFISHRPLLAILLGNFSNIYGQVNNSKSACLITNCISVTAKKKKEKRQGARCKHYSFKIPKHAKL